MKLEQYKSFGALINRLNRELGDKYYTVHKTALGTDKYVMYRDIDRIEGFVTYFGLCGCDKFANLIRHYNQLGN